MSYVSIGRIRRSLEALPQYHPFFGVTLLSMLQSGVNTNEPIDWGSNEENALLRNFYSPQGAPPRKPFFVPFGREEEQGYWRNEKYSGGSLQSARTRERFADALHHPTKKKYAFKNDYLDVLTSLLPQRDGIAKRIPVLDLAAWLFRERDLTGDIQTVIADFRAEFGLQDDAVFDRLFDPAADTEPAAFFAAEKADADELLLLTGGVPSGPILGGRDEPQVLSALETYLQDTAKLRLPAGFVGNFYYALKTQRFVVLAGRPGTGKTAFAQAYANGLREVFAGAVTTIIVPIGHEQGEAETIGYAKIAGGLEPTELTRELFLSNRRNDLYVVILDEMNLAQVDYYLAKLLPAIESEALVELPGLPTQFALPPDSYLVGTVNSFIEEGSRVALSSPVKRRANIIEMPNILDELVRSGDEDGFRTLCRELLQQTLNRYVRRREEANASVLDTFRIGNLEAALGGESRVLSNSLLTLLWSLVSACAVSPLTSLTAGVLQDILDFLALADGQSVLEALDNQVAQKLVPQLNGPAAAASKVRELLMSQEHGEQEFPRGIRALDEILETSDPSSGLVYFKY